LALAATAAMAEKVHDQGEVQRCADGTTTTVKKDACTGHGGIATMESPVMKVRDDKKPQRKDTDPADLAKGKRDTEERRMRENKGRTVNDGRLERGRAITFSAKCNDGTSEVSARRNETCRTHGGVSQWLEP
jgi:hypothetical protein